MFLNNIQDSNENNDDDMSSDSNCEYQIPIIDLDVLKSSVEIVPFDQQNNILLKNKHYHKNLGQNSAQYGHREINLQNFKFESQISDEKIENTNQEQPQIKISEPEIIEPVFEILQLNSKGSINFEEEGPQFLDIEALKQTEKSSQEAINIVQTKEEEEKQKLKQSISEILPKPPICPYPDPILYVELPQYMKQFLTSPIPWDGIFQCIIKRDRSGLNRFSEKYTLMWEKTYQFLLSGKRLTNTRKYIITQDQDFKQSDELLLVGKMQLNQDSKSTYTMYDNGVKPKYANAFKQRRIQLGFIQFDSKSDGPKKPRKAIFTLRNTKKDIIFTNRQPQLRQQFNQFIYTLDFFGRVKQASVKNLQLVKNEDQIDKIYFQFGKVAKDIFSLDFCAPLSPLIAFQIALTIFDYRGN